MHVFQFITNIDKLNFVTKDACDKGIVNGTLSLRGDKCEIHPPQHNHSSNSNSNFKVNNEEQGLSDVSFSVNGLNSPSTLSRSYHTRPKEL